MLFALSAIAGATVIRKQGKEDEEVIGKEDAFSSLSNNPEGHSIVKRSPQAILVQKMALAKLLAVWGVQYLPILIQG